MRTVTFADLPLVEYLKQNYVVVWHNQSPDLFSSEAGQQEKYTAEQVKAYPQGGGGGNVRSYFCTPDGGILYYLEGYWSGERYLAEARFARDLFDKVKSLPATEQAELARRTLAKHEEMINRERQAIREQHPEEFAGRFRPTEVRKREAALGLLARTLQLSTREASRPVPPILEELRLANIRRGAIK
ncbi:MAG: hypothetical protein K2R98_30010 [Gemmataceae bacterium]|nr:hypothetical protein [Gemmataceae bacterium]